MDPGPVTPSSFQRQGALGGDLLGSASVGVSLGRKCGFLAPGHTHTGLLSGVCHLLGAVTPGIIVVITAVAAGLLIDYVPGAEGAELEFGRADPERREGGEVNTLGRTGRRGLVQPATLQVPAPSSGSLSEPAWTPQRRLVLPGQGVGARDSPTPAATVGASGTTSRPCCGGGMGCRPSTARAGSQAQAPGTKAELQMRAGGICWHHPIGPA